eukprot:7251297-Pyramimonas_sp.AAC.1
MVLREISSRPYTAACAGRQRGTPHGNEGAHARPCAENYMATRGHMVAHMATRARQLITNHGRREE